MKNLTNKITEWKTGSSSYKRITFMGYLTSVEVKALFDLGCQDLEGKTFKSKYYIEAVKNVKEGKMVPSWFYFFPSQELLKKV